MHTVPVACCCSKFETGQNFSKVQIPTMLGVVLLGVFGQQCCVLFHLPTMLGVVGQQFCVLFHLPTMLGVVGQQFCVLFHLPTLLGVVGQQFCVRLHGALVTDILIIFSNINFSLLIIHMNFCAIYMYPALYAARKISLNFLFWGT